MGENGDGLDAWRRTQSKLSKLFVHDLKNPISALFANLSFLQSIIVEGDEEAHAAVADSILAVEMLLRFSENLNIIAMAEVEEAFEPAGASLDDFLHSAARRNAGFARSAGVRITAVDPLPKTHVLWQHRFAEAVIDNLLLCSVRHSPPGTEVRIQAGIEGDKVRIVVSDQGKAVAPEHAEALFTRDCQADAKKNPSCRYGRGLGLYTAGLAATALRGALAVDQRDGTTRFVALFPVEPTA